MSKHRKSQLKEMADKGIMSPASFETEREGGADHEPGWKARVTVDGKSATGVGHSKSEAEDNAAGAILPKLEPR